MMEETITSYLKSPQGMEMVQNYISSKEGKEAIGSYIKTPQGKKMAQELLPVILDSLGIPAAMKKTVLENLGKKRKSAA